MMPVEIQVAYLLNSTSGIARPVAMVHVRNPRNGRGVTIVADLDTGADVTALNHKYLSILGIEDHELSIKAILTAPHG